MDNISPIRGIGSSHEARISLDQFRKASQEHLTRLAQTQRSLQEVSIPFSLKGDIRPVHCKIALDSLDEMNGCIEEFGALFYKTTDLPLVITAMRYQTLHILHCIETQTSQIVELLDGYRTICMTPYKYAQKQRNNIYDSFEKLLQSLTDISQQVRVLNDEACFQEERLISIN